MADYSELKRLAETFPEYDYDSNTEPFFNGPSGESLGGGSTGFYCVYGPDFEIDGESYEGVTLVENCPADQAKFICKAKAGILALISENERLEGCEDVLRQLASYVGSGGYNAPEVDPETFARKIMDGINILNDPLAQLVTKKGEQIDQLKAEIAGLKTGYEAYEQVNAGLKAEVARSTAREILQLAEIESLRKDAERYRWLRIADWWRSPVCVIRNPKEQAKLGSDCPSGDRLDAAIDAAVGKGEQS